jgi:hypothetical protein
VLLFLLLNADRCGFIDVNAASRTAASRFTAHRS